MKRRLSWIHFSNRVSVGDLFEDEIKCACFKKS